MVARPAHNNIADLGAIQRVFAQSLQVREIGHGYLAFLVELAELIVVAVSPPLHIGIGRAVRQ